MFDTKVIFPKTFEITLAVYVADEDDEDDKDEDAEVLASHGIALQRDSVAGEDAQENSSEEHVNIAVACAEDLTLPEFVARLTPDYLRQLAEASGYPADAITAFDVIRVEESAHLVSVLPNATTAH